MKRFLPFLILTGLLFGQDVLKTISGKEYKGEYLKTEGGKVFFIQEGAINPTQVPIISIHEIISEAGKKISFQNDNSDCVSGDCKNGQGTFTFPDGRKYIGEYKDGKWNGQGTFTFPDGRKYIGEFKDGRSNGQGTSTFPNGTKYVGEFKDGRSNGQGTFTFPNGTKYVGEFKDGKQNGQGTLTYPTVSKYIGEFKDGKRNGQGVMFKVNGEILSGIWVNDNFMDVWTIEAVENFLKNKYPEFKGLDYEIPSISRLLNEK
jgi:hypothetical protein